MTQLTFPVKAQSQLERTSATIANSMVATHYLGPVRSARVLIALTDGEAVAGYGRPTTGNIRYGLPATELMRLWSPE